MEVMSFNDLLKSDPEILQNLIFTFNPNICNCRSLEEIQCLIDQLTRDNQKQQDKNHNLKISADTPYHFFQIKIIKLH